MDGNTRLLMNDIVSTLRQVNEDLHTLNNHLKNISDQRMPQIQEDFNGPEGAYCTLAYTKMADIVTEAANNVLAASEWAKRADEYKTNFVRSQM